jgi:hypothetical protein
MDRETLEEWREHAPASRCIMVAGNEHCWNARLFERASSLMRVRLTPRQYYRKAGFTGRLPTHHVNAAPSREFAKRVSASTALRLAGA